MTFTVDGPGPQIEQNLKKGHEEEPPISRRASRRLAERRVDAGLHELVLRAPRRREGLARVRQDPPHQQTEHKKTPEHAPQGRRMRHEEAPLFDLRSV